MGKHDRFNWENTSEGYFKNRTDSLTEQLENAQKQVAQKDAYIDKLEKALAESADRCARLEKAIVKETLRNVEV